MRRLHIGPLQILLVLAIGVFGTLLSITGWTWPLEGVAALLPVATYLALT